MMLGAGTTRRTTAGEVAILPGRYGVPIGRVSYVKNSCDAWTALRVDCRTVKVSHPRAGCGLLGPLGGPASGGCREADLLERLHAGVRCRQQGDRGL